MTLALTSLHPGPPQELQPGYSVKGGVPPRTTTRKHTKVALFGHFGISNFGNEATIQALLCNLRRLMPEAEITCVCSAPEVVTGEYRIPAVPICGVVVQSWDVRNPIVRLARKLFVGIPSELYRWLKAMKTLWRQDMFIVVGTGLLTDAFGLASWGPYNVFKWSVIAKLCGCRVIFTSVGAGPLNTGRGRLFVKSALSLARLRTYRDEATLEYLKGIGFCQNDDRVYPDLAFSLPAPARKDRTTKGRRPVVGVGLMTYAGMYGVERTTEAHYAEYMNILLAFVEWLLKREYDVHLLIGDLNDAATVQGFQASLRARLGNYDQMRVIAEPIASAEDLLSQIEETDLVVATRFHNVLLALFLNKPSIAISFHHKCSSLMKQMGLSEYYQEINSLDLDRLIQQFCDLERNATTLKAEIRRKADECRAALDEQYKTILSALNV